jgi:enoyl-CoA hydratase/carnithine racemase
MYEQILYEVAEPLATLTLNRPERLNAFTTRMGEEIKHAVARAETDPAVVAIVLTGAGRGFCAGADMDDLRSISAGRRGGARAELPADPGDPQVQRFRGPYAWLASVRKPVIAAVNGPVAGMAYAMILYCDLRFASERSLFTTAFSRRGLIAEWGIGWTLPRLVGPAHALDLLFSARRVDASEAERIGLVNRTLPHDELLPFVRRYVEELAANVSPASMQVMKRQVWTSLTREPDEALEEAIRLMRESFDRPDFKEGVESFLQKRSPRFPRV